MTTPKTPFDLLAEHYGPSGKGSRKLCEATIGDVIDSEVGGSVRCGLCGAVSTTPPYLFTLKHKSGFDPDNPFFKVLWESCRCSHHEARWTDMGGGGGGWTHRVLPNGAGACPCGVNEAGPNVGYVRCSRIEALVPLMEASPQLTLRHSKLPLGQLHYKLHLNEWWVASFPCPNANHDHSHDLSSFERGCLVAEADNPLDALCAAVLAKEGVTI